MNRRNASRSTDTSRSTEVARASGDVAIVAVAAAKAVREAGATDADGRTEPRPETTERNQARAAGGTIARATRIGHGRRGRADVLRAATSASAAARATCRRASASSFRRIRCRAASTRRISISYSSGAPNIPRTVTRGKTPPSFKVQYPTDAGLKCLYTGTGTVQEVFLVCRDSGAARQWMRENEVIDE